MLCSCVPRSQHPGHNCDMAAADESTKAEMLLEKLGDRKAKLREDTWTAAERRKCPLSPPFQGVEVPIAVSDADSKILLSLRPVLCDPITGCLMEDAMVAVNCGHSFGGSSLQRVAETNVCLTCGAITGSLVPNYALRSAVRAYLEKDLSERSVKRKKEQCEEPQHSDCQRTPQDAVHSSDNTASSEGKAKSGQFPFSVNDHVVIKGNKRTPERFFGKEAVITSQCLNGWYLVKTVDGDESIRLQYRSLQKMEDAQQSSESGEVAKTRSYVTRRSTASKILPQELGTESSVDVKVEKEPFVVINSQRVILPWQANFAVEEDSKKQIARDGGGSAMKWPRERGVVCFSTESNQLEDSQGTSQILEDQYARSQHAAAGREVRREELLLELKKEILQLEKRVPWKLLRLSWKDLRMQWRSRVRECILPKDLASQVHIFRLHLLLASAGGYSDEEWERELVAAADVECLAVLWNRLSEDVFKLLCSKSRTTTEGVKFEDQQEFDLKEVQAAFPQLCVEGMSVVSVIAATILASADAIARGEKDADEILEVPMKLIQQHGRHNLASIREALEREKRHLTARLSHLGEDRYSKLPFLAQSKGDSKVAVNNDDDTPPSDEKRAC